MNAFVNDGMKSVYTTKHKGQPSPLNQYKEKILEDFEKEAPQTRAEAATRIEELCGIKPCITSAGNFLKKTNSLTKSQEAFQQKPTKKNKKNF